MLVEPRGQRDERRTITHRQRQRPAEADRPSGRTPMLITTQCPHCGVVLNLPEGAQGRRLRCPKCSSKFYSGTPESRPPTWAPGIAEATPASSMTRPVFRDDE